MVYLSVYITDPKLVHELDKYVKAGRFRSRSHAIEEGIKLVIQRERRKDRLISF